MAKENEFSEVLRDLISKILSNDISREELKKRIRDELETKNIWDSDDLLTTDCYYALKHIDEEQISVKEWLYFQECFSAKRKYNLADKFHFISTN